MSASIHSHQSNSVLDWCPVDIHYGYAYARGYAQCTHRICNYKCIQWFSECSARYVLTLGDPRYVEAWVEWFADTTYNLLSTGRKRFPRFLGYFTFHMCTNGGTELLSRLQMTVQTCENWICQDVKCLAGLSIAMPDTSDTQGRKIYGLKIQFQTFFFVFNHRNQITVITFPKFDHSNSLRSKWILFDDASSTRRLGATAILNERNCVLEVHVS